MDGKKTLPPAMIHKFAKALKLDFVETQFFEGLVLYSQSHSQEQSEYYLRRIADLRRSKHKGAAQINKNTILENWYYPAVLTSVHGTSIFEAVTHVQKQTCLPEEVIEPAIQALLKADYLAAAEGRYVMSDTYLYSRDEKRAKAQRKAYLKQHLQLSQQAFDRMFDSERGHFFAHTFTIKSSDYKKFVEQVDHLLEQMVVDADNSKSDKVMQVNVQTFCLEQGLTPRIRS